jgi:hypothetical protein
MVIFSNSASPVVTGFTAATWNSMGGYGNCTESLDLGNLASSDWKITPGAANLGAWLLGFRIILEANSPSTFAAGAYAYAAITRYPTGPSRYVIASDSEPTGLSTTTLSGSFLFQISNASEYFTVDTYVSSGSYNVYGLYFWGMRVR